MPFENPPQNNTEPYLDKLTPEEEKKLQAEIKRKAKELAKKGVAIVNAEHLAETEARDAADAILGKEKSKKGWFGKLVQTYTEVIRRTNKVNELKKEIKETGNIYAGLSENNNDHNKAMAEIAERFTTEFGDKLVNTKAGEEWKKLEKKNGEGVRVNEEVRNLVKEYASTKMDEQSFKEAKKRIFKSIKDDSLKGAETYADNLFEIAKNTRLAIEHGIKMDELDLDFDIIIGKAKSTLKTEAKYSYVDQISDKLGKTVIGKYISAPTISTAVGIAYTATVVTSKRLLQSKLATYGTFGLTAVASGVIMGIDKSKTFADERRQHQREMAKGNEIAPDSKRREEMDKWSYQTVDARKTMDTLYSNLYRKSKDGGMELKDMTEDEMRGALATISDIEARINIGDTKKIDLISYSKGEVEKERTEMEIARARAKVQIEKLASDPKYKSIFNGKNLEEYLDSANAVAEKVLFEGEKGISKRDREFTKEKYWKALQKGFWTAVVGATIGATVQEVSAAFNDKVTGVFEGIFSKDHVAPGGSTQTPLEHLRGWMTGHPTHLDTAGGKVFDFGQEHIKLPPGYEIVRNTDGTFNIGHGNETIGENIALTFNADGSLSPESASLLGEHGIIATDGGTIDVGSKTEVNLNAHDYLARHPEIETHQIDRDIHYDNDTPMYPDPNNPGHLLGADFNELKEQWGGVNGTGIDEHGNFVMNVKQMSPGGSWHENGVFEVDAQEKIKNGGLKLLLSLSEGTQGHPVYVDIDEHGNAIIDPNSEVGKLFFGTENGHAVFKGRFAEVAEMMGNKDGVDHVRLLATVEGQGIDQIKETIDTLHKEQLINLGTPLDDEPPYFIPLMYRNPLEPVKEKEKGKEITEEPPIPPFIDEDPESMNPYYYPYGMEGDREKWAEDFSLRILKNPEAKLDPTEEISWYFEDQKRRYPGYLEKELDTLLKQEPKSMGKNVENVICLAVAGHQEHDNIYRTLDTYRIQKTRDGKNIWDGDNSKNAIFIYVNWPKGKDSSKTLKEIERFKKEHPEVLIDVYQEEINTGKVEVGWYKKKILDAALKKHLDRKNGKDIFLVANDADMTFSSSNYLDDLNRKMKDPKNEKYDAILGRYDLDPSVYEKNPTFHSIMRYWQFMESAMHSKHNFVGTQGRNTILRGSSYAAVGGNRTRDFWADVEFGELFDYARKRNAVAYQNSLWLTVDPRREIDKFKSGEMVAHTWSDFNTREVRGNKLNAIAEDLDIQKLAIARESDPIVSQFRNRLQIEIQEITNLFARITPGLISTLDLQKKHIANTKALVKEAARFMGIKVILLDRDNDSGFDISITDTSKLRGNLLGFKEENRKISKIKNHELYEEEKNKKVVEKKPEIIKKEIKKNPKEITDLSKEYIEYLGKHPELKAKSQNLYDRYFNLKNYNNLKDVAVKKRFDEIYEAFKKEPKNESKSMNEFLVESIGRMDEYFAKQMKEIKSQEKLMGILKEVGYEKAGETKVNDKGEKVTPLKITNLEKAETRSLSVDELDEEIKLNLINLIESQKAKQPEIQKFELKQDGDGFKLESIVKINNTGNSLKPTATIRFDARLENKNGELALGDYEIDAGFWATGEAKKAIEPLLPELIPGIKKYFEDKSKKEIESMQIKDGKLVIGYKK